MKSEKFYFIKGEKIPEKVMLEAIGEYKCPTCFSATVHDGTYGETYCTNDECNEATRKINIVKRKNIEEAYKNIKRNNEG